MSRIRAGEAFVAVSVDNKNLISGLREASARIRETSQTFSSASSVLNPELKISGADAFSASLREIRKEAVETANAAKKLSDRFVITAGDVWNAFRGLASNLGGLLGGIGDQFDKMSLRTGLSTTALSEFAHAAAISGASVSDIEGAMRSLASQLVAAENGSSRAEKAFSILGLDVQKIASLSPERQFEEVARAIASIKEPTERAGAAMRIFGSAGAALLPLFANGPDGLAKLRAEARALGVSIDAETAKMGADFTDATTRLKTALQGVGLSVAKILTPALIELANAATRIFSAFSNLVKNNPVLSSSLLGIAGAVATLTSGVYLASNAWTLLSGAVASASKVLSKASALALANPWTALAVAIGAAVAAVAAYKFAVSNVPKFSSDAQDALEAGKAEREQDRADLERLRTLEKISLRQKLSNEEIAEAARLAERLRQRYGDVGIEVDAVAGSIKGATSAQAELNRKILEGQANQLRGSIAEAQANESSGALRRKMMEDEVGWFENLTGKKRGSTWGDWWGELFGREGADGMANDSGEKGLEQILEGDAEFQKRLNAAIQKNRANIQEWQAELNAIETALEGAAESAPENLVPNVETLERSEDVVADFIERGTEEEKTALEKRIETIKNEREKLIRELRKLADPSGEVDWSNAGAVDEFLRNNPTARAIQNQALQVDASAQSQIARAQAEDAQRQENERRQAEEKRLQEERAAAEARSKGEKDLAEAMRERFEKFASPAEKLALAEEDLQKAVEDLTAAQQSGDSGTIAAALRRLSDTEDKYVSAAEAVDKIGENVGKSMGGTFSAWQASTAASVGFEKQTLNEQKRQTNYLRQIYSAMQRNGNGGAVFA